MRIPVRIQMTAGENGAAALYMILGYFGKYVSMEELREVCVASRNGSSPEQICKAAAFYGLDTEIKELSFEDLKKQKFPLVVQWRKRYYGIIKRITSKLVYAIDPAKGEIKIPVEKFKSMYTGTAILFSKGKDFIPGGRKESLLSLILPKLKPLAKPMFILLVLSLICIWLDITLSKGIKYFMDNVVAKGNDFSFLPNFIIDNTDIEEDPNILRMFSLVWLYAIMLGVLIFTIMKDHVINDTSRRMSAVSGSRMFKHMFGLPLSFFEQYSVGELMGRLDANVSLDHSLVESLVPRIINTFMVVFYFIMLLGYNKTIALICIAIEVINTIVVLYLQEKNAIVSRAMATSNNALNSSVLNGMNMIDTIKSTGSEKAFFNMWYRSQSQANESKLTSFSVNRIITMVNNIHSYLLSGIQLFLGAYFITRGMFTLGTMALFQTVLSHMRSSLSSALSSINMLQTMRTNIERINDINNRPVREEIPLLPGIEYDKLPGQITVSHVCYRYNKGDDLAVNDVSLEVFPGQMVAIVGGTGCGKSTLLKMMADLYVPESGEILYSGLKRSEIPDVVFHSSVTSVDQETVVFEDSVYANIRMWDETIEDYEVYLAARDAQIHSRIMRDREGYGTDIRENGSNFSGGELQRLELARALAHEPTMLFLDEFTSALDALTENKVIQSIRKKGTTCVIVAHRLSTIVDCDRIYVMEKGRIVQEGTHSELYAQEGLYRQLIGSQ